MSDDYGWWMGLPTRDDEEPAPMEPTTCDCDHPSPGSSRVGDCTRCHRLIVDG